MYRNMRCRQWFTRLTNNGNKQLLQLHGTLSMLTRDSPGSFGAIRSRCSHAQPLLHKDHLVDISKQLRSIPIY